MTHPSGANGEFKVRRVLHGTSQTETEGHCTIRPLGYWGNYYERISGAPSAYQIASLYQKTISGPGIPIQAWSYDYRPSWTAPYISETVVSHSSGRVEKYKFGNDKLTNYGQLLQKTISEGSQGVTTEIYAYAGLNTAQNYPFSPGRDYSISQTGWADQFISEYRPLIKREILQDGRRFIWEINIGCLQASAYCYDSFVRPLSATKRSVPQ